MKTGFLPEKLLIWGGWLMMIVWLLVQLFALFALFALPSCTSTKDIKKSTQQSSVSSHEKEKTNTDLTTGRSTRITETWDDDVMVPGSKISAMRAIEMLLKGDTLKLANTDATTKVYADGSGNIGVETTVNERKAPVKGQRVTEINENSHLQQQIEKEAKKDSTGKSSAVEKHVVKKPFKWYWGPVIGGCLLGVILLIFPSLKKKIKEWISSRLK